MAHFNAMFFLGIIVGSVAGFGLIWWVAVKKPSPEPFFSRFLKMELKSSRLVTRSMIYELQRKTDDLTVQLRAAKQEIQELKRKMAGKENESSPEKGFSAPAVKTAGAELTLPQNAAQVANGTLADGVLKREIYCLSREGLSPEKIAGHLKIGQGKVELILALDKKPSWVIGAKKIKGT